MSRFGTTGTFTYAPGDTLVNGTEVGIDAQDMFQFPFETTKINDSVSYRSKAGRPYEYKNWSKDVHTFEFVDLREITKGSLWTMVNSTAILSFQSPPNTDWGTFRVVPDSWVDSETSHERYDVTFSIEGI